MGSDTFDLGAGALCLDFINTLEWRLSEDPKENLNDYADLLRWGKAAGTMPSDGVEKIHQITESNLEKAEAVYTFAIRLREAIYQIVDGHLEGREADKDDLTLLNDALSGSLSHLRIKPSPPGFAWAWPVNADDLDQLLWPVVRSAAELLVSDDLDRLGQCADDRGCGYLFIDTSRNRSRRWCSMESCGNRAKVRRHYQQQRKKREN